MVNLFFNTVKHTSLLLGLKKKLLMLISIIIPTSCLLPKILLLFSEISLRKSYQYPVHTSYLYILYNMQYLFRFSLTLWCGIHQQYTQSYTLFENIVTYINFWAGFNHPTNIFYFIPVLKFICPSLYIAKLYDWVVKVKG